MALNVLICFIFLLLFYIVLVIIGGHESFKGTFVEQIRYYITDGILDGSEWLIVRTFGDKGNRCLASTETLCCYTSHPFGQLLFLSLFGATYYAFWEEVFPLLSDAGISNVHKYVGTLVAAAALLFFFLVCYTDPGVINHRNVQLHVAAYEFDGLIFKEGVCETCLLPKPARSKHDRILNKCIGRYDHYCVWIDNVVGMNNVRFFLMFCATTSAACLYGGIVGFLAIRGDMRRRNIWSQSFLHPVTQEVIKLGDKWSYVSSYVGMTYPIAFAASLFAAFAGLIVLGFAVLQFFRVIINETTNEGYKRSALRDAIDPQSSADFNLKENIYNKGPWLNLNEVFFPNHYLRKAYSKERRKQQ